MNIKQLRLTEFPTGHSVAAHIERELARAGADDEEIDTAFNRHHDCSRWRAVAFTHRENLALAETALAKLIQACDHSVVLETAPDLAVCLICGEGVV